MSASARAAQFAPFAALSGFEGAVFESARLTEERITLDESEIERLDRILFGLRVRNYSVPVDIAYFSPDERKCGGTYVTARGYVKEIDLYGHKVNMKDGTVVPIEYIISIEEIDDEPEK